MYMYMYMYIDSATCRPYRFATGLPVCYRDTVRQNATECDAKPRILGKLHSNKGSSGLLVIAAAVT